MIVASFEENVYIPKGRLSAFQKTKKDPWDFGGAFHPLPQLVCLSLIFRGSISRKNGITGYEKKYCASCFSASFNYLVPLRHAATRRGNCAELERLNFKKDSLLLGLSLAFCFILQAQENERKAFSPSFKKNGE